MKERGLFLTDDSARAILRTVDPKTQTRRVVKLPHNNPLGVWEPAEFGGPNGGRTARGETIPLQHGIWHTRTGDFLACPYGDHGDRLWAREAWCHLADVRTADPGSTALRHRAFYRADYPGNTLMHDDDPAEKIKWRSSRFMPRWASRITLDIVRVRAERLQDISEADATAEGIEPFVTDDPDLQGMWRDYSEPGMASGNPIGSYMTLWNQLNAARGYAWDLNPWVWVVEFRRVDWC